MKSIDKIISEIKVNKANLDHISTTGIINGSLYMSLQDAIAKTQIEYYNQAVKDCAESATASMIQETLNGGKKAIIDKESILKNLK